MRSLTKAVTAAVMVGGLVLGNAAGASATKSVLGSKTCGFGGPAAASTANVTATSVHYHVANAVAWGSRTFGSGLHRYSYGNGVVAMQIVYETGVLTGYSFSCVNGSF